MARYTFLLPAYKGQFLDEMLNSIQSQSYKDYRVIISDDCSPDDIISICSPYLLDRRFVYRKNEKNLGSTSLVSHWNFLISLCNTDYLIIASDDDIYDSEFLREINELVNKYPNVELIRARSRRINEGGDFYAKDNKYEEYENVLEFMYSSFGDNRVHCIGNYVFKTKCLRQKGGFVDFPLAWFSDDATVFSCGINGVANTSDVLFSFRSSPYNISYENRKDRKIAKEKVIATCSFFEWMNHFVNQISIPNTLYLKTLYRSICNNYNNRVKWQLQTYYLQLNFKSLISLMKWMKAHQLFESKRIMFYFVKTWIVSRIKQNLHIR